MQNVNHMLNFPRDHACSLCNKTDFLLFIEALNSCVEVFGKFVLNLIQSQVHGSVLKDISNTHIKAVGTIPKIHV